MFIKFYIYVIFKLLYYYFYVVYFIYFIVGIIAAKVPKLLGLEQIGPQANFLAVKVPKPHFFVIPLVLGPLSDLTEHVSQSRAAVFCFFF